MLDRISLYPGRVTLTPVSGQTNTYDMERADSPTQEGTALNKASLLKDTTAALYGLTASAVPDEVLGWIGKYNEHWWGLYEPAYSYYAEKRTILTSAVEFMGQNFEGYSFPVTFSYSTSVTVSSSGSVSLASPQTITCGESSSDMISFFSTLCSLAPIYLKARNNGNTANVIYYIPAGATYYNGSSNPGGGDQDPGTTMCGYYWDNKANYLYFGGTAPESIRASTVSSKIVQVPAGETTYEHSTDRNAYPDSGTVDGITYSYLGIPFEKFPTIPCIETGTYKGTGKSGSNNPNSLTFSFKPKLVIVVFAENVGWYSLGGLLCILEDDAGMSIIGHNMNTDITSSVVVSRTNDGMTISWYSTLSNAALQCNASKNYRYLALG